MIVIIFIFDLLLVCFIFIGLILWLKVFFSIWSMGLYNFFKIILFNIVFILINFSFICFWFCIDKFLIILGNLLNNDFIGNIWVLLRLFCICCKVCCFFLIICWFCWCSILILFIVFFIWVIFFVIFGIIFSRDVSLLFWGFDEFFSFL